MEYPSLDLLGQGFEKLKRRASQYGSDFVEPFTRPIPNMEGGNRPFNMAEMWANSKALAKQMEDKRAKGMEGMSGLDKLALSTMATPIVGDIAGLAADAQRFYQDPESRTPTNFGLSALGAIPFVPYMGAMVKGQKGASPFEAKRMDAAKELEKAGVPRETILEQTGWWKGPDKQWRAEIDDSAFKMNPQAPQMSEHGFKTAKGSDVFEHQPLKLSYPEMLENTTVSFNPSISSRGEVRTLRGSKLLGTDDFHSMQLNDPASEIASQNKINHRKKVLADTIGDKEGNIKTFMDDGMTRVEAEAEYLDEVEYWKDAVREAHNEKKLGFMPGTPSTALHESQHIVQGIEGFGRGGSPEEFMSDIVRAKNEQDSMIRSINDQMRENVRIRDKLELSKYEPGVQSRIDEFDDEYQKLIAMKTPYIHNYISDPLMSASDKYRSLSGEAESRAVQSRRNLTPAQRKSRPFWMDFDVPESDQIVRFK
jgi:hypothetical protein